jgi:hypothetical protein
MNMIRKMIFALLTSALMLGLVSAIEPPFLGHGPINTSINVDAGSVQPGHIYTMSRTGFVPPTPPQPKALSSNVMIYQTEKLLREAESLRAETFAAYNNTLALALKIENDTLRMDVLAKEAMSSSENSSQNAAQAEQSLDAMQDLYNKTMMLSLDIEAMAGETKNATETSMKYLALMAGYRNESQKLYNETLNLSMISSR